MKDKIIKDLHTVLYTLPLESLPDNWTVRVNMAKAIIDENHLFFKEKEGMSESQYWEANIEPIDHFFDRCCPGIIPNEIAFGYMCEMFFDWDLYERTSRVVDPFADLFNAIAAIVNPYTVTSVHEPHIVDLSQTNAA